ncbi:MAG: acyltransferase, partial [Tolypothrix sp. Co-bin9]|nr:acyltransferase [Tolypothrix sp. Co-bin9]
MTQPKDNYVINKLKQLVGEGLLYFANRIVNHIPFHFVRLGFYRSFLKFDIGLDSAVFMGTWFDTKSNFKLGNHSVINQNCRLDNRGGIIIGDNVSISADVCILTADHDLQSADFAGRTRPVTFEDYVFLGTRAMILP